MNPRSRTPFIADVLSEQRPFVRYGLAVLGVALATLATHYVPVIRERAVFLIFFFAILNTAIWLGSRPGLLSIALSVLVINQSFLSSGWLSAPEQTLVLNAGFLVFAGLISASAYYFRRLMVALRDSQRDLDHAQAVAQTGSWRLEIPGNALRWSEETHRIFGIPTGTPLTYETFLSTVHPDDREYVDRRWKAALRGEPYDITYRIVAAGQSKWVRARSELEFDPTGALVSGFGTVQDITERWQTQQALEQSQARLMGIIDSAMDAIITIDEEQRILLFNAAAERMFRRPAQEMRGESLDGLIPERHRTAHRQHIPAFGRTGSTARRMGALGEIKGLRADGEEFPIEASISKIETGGQRLYTVILRDITERTQAEAALRESEDRFARFMRHLPGLAWIKDTQGRYVYVNDAAEKAFGAPREALYGKTDDEIFPADTAAQFCENDRRAWASPAGIVAVETLLHEDGVLHDSLVSKFPILRADGEANLIGGVAVDITELTQAQAKLQEQARQLREADRLKNEFLAMLAHELRNPLAPVRNAVQVMRLLMPNEPRLTWARDVVDRQVTHMVRLIDDLLDVSRISRGRITLDKERIELAGVIELAVEASRPLIDAHRHTLDVRLPPQPIHLDGDAVRLVQVFTNLLNNAARYTGEGGRIEIAAGVEDGRAVVRVADNGSGIAADRLPHVFELFWQGERALDRSQGGLGIGLTLVKHIVELHGGEIEAKSPGLGQGSAFTVRLLAQSEPPKRTEPTGLPALAATPAMGLRVLVVDDNFDAAKSIALLLELQGHRVEIATDGPGALALAQRFSPQVAVVDIGLPVMDGYEVARRLRAQPATQDVLLIALTGYGQAEDRERAKASGFDHHLVKPADAEQLQAVIAEYQARRETEPDKLP